MNALRAYAPADFDDLARLIQALFAYHRAAQDAPPFSLEEARGTARHWVTQPGVEVLLYVEGGAAVGAAKLRWEQDCPFLEDLVVQADRRGRGVGTAFLEAIEQHVRARGSDALFLSQVWPGNLRALDFYIAQGYDLLNTIELRKDFQEDRRGRPISFLGRTLYLARNVPQEE